MHRQFHEHIEHIHRGHPGADLDDGFGPGPGGGRRGRRGRGPGRRGPGGPGGPWGRGGRRRRARVSRGEVRNTILVLLTESPMHGYQIMQELDERSGGAWHPSPGSIYPTLQQLSDEGLIVGEAADGKNVFSLTEAGREAADAIEEPPAWERFDEDGSADVLGLRRAMFQFQGAVRQIAVSGSEAQVAEARRIVAEARKSLYRLLAEDD